MKMAVVVVLGCLLGACSESVPVQVQQRPSAIGNSSSALPDTSTVSTRMTDSGPAASAPKLTARSPAQAVASTAAPTDGSKTGRVSVPTCGTVKDAFVTANVAAGYVVDKTANAQRGAALGTLPYKILRCCEVNLPGHPAPSQVQIVGPANATLLAALEAQGPGCKDLPARSGYGDRAFLCADAGSFYGLIGTLMHIGPSIKVADLEHVAQDLILKMT